MKNRIVLSIVGLTCFATTSLAQPVYHSTPDWISSDHQVSTGAALADLNRDGWLDLIIANGNDIYRQRVVVYYNQGNGTFPSSPDWQSSDTKYNGHLDVADVNGDGWPDVAVGHLLIEGGPAAKVYLNNSGILSSTPDWESDEEAPAFDAKFGDVNNDGRPDLVVVTGWPYDYVHNSPNYVYMNIDGQLETTASWVSDDSYDYSGGLWVDADNDGWLDLIMTGDNTDTWLYHNDNGTLDTTATWRTTDNSGQFAIMATAGDVDDDGHKDLFVTDNTQLFNGNGRFRRYDGTTGYFETTPSWSYYDGYGSAIALADVDADGDLDLATGAWWDRTRLFFNDHGQYPSSPDWNSGVTSVVEKIVFGDINPDCGRAIVKRKIFAPDGNRRLFELPKPPIQNIVTVKLDGVELLPSEYTYNRELGWITVMAAPTEKLFVTYTTSLSLDMVVSNWDSSLGNYVYYNQIMTDCNSNGEPDGCDIENGVSQDRNHNGIPDECERFKVIPPHTPGLDPINIEPIDW